MTKPYVNQKGVVLLASFLTSTSLMILALGLWTQSTVFLRGAESSVMRLEAFHLAEGALDQAIVNLEKDINYSGQGTATMYKGGTQIGFYSSYVETPDENNPLIKRVTGNGFMISSGLTKGWEYRNVVAYVKLHEPPNFDFALFADKGVSLAGSPGVIIDSYNSTHGPYGAGNSLGDATVGTNSAQVDAVRLDGNVTVKGHVNVGPGGDLNTAIYLGPNTSITGTKGNLVEPKTFDEVKVPKSAVPLGAVNIASNTDLHLNGTYHMDSLSITGKAKITTDGPTVIYLTGDASIAGNGFATAESLPKNLIIAVVGEHTLSYSGNADFFGAIYAPKSHVAVSGNGMLHGAVLSNTYDQTGNGQFHFDEALKENNKVTVRRAEVISWQESGKYF